MDERLRFVARLLGGEKMAVPGRATTSVHPASHELASFDKLNTWYYSDAPKSRKPVLDTTRTVPEEN